MPSYKSALLGFCLAAAMSVPALAQDFRIVAPAGPGGGWDQTARSLQTALQAEGLGKNVQVVNVPGAGGTIGLAQFVNQSKGDPKALIVGGYVMVGAVIANNAPVKLDQVTPIARLTGEYETIVVPTSSPIKDIGELMAKLKADPGSVSWGGGSAGGTDHIAVGLIAKAVGVEPTKINYIPFSGGGEALAAIVGGKVTAGISGYGEFEGQIKAGKLRVLAITAPARQANIDGPTLKESGVNVELQNWRSVWAAPGITDEQKASIIATFEKLNASKSWKDTLATKGWADTFLAGDAFAAYLKTEIEQTTTVLKDIGLAK
jgi:putative tricarboxylic transport membrane protein